MQPLMSLKLGVRKSFVDGGGLLRRIPNHSVFLKSCATQKTKPAFCPLQQKLVTYGIDKSVKVTPERALIFLDHSVITHDV